jgi:hypothetical protein
MKRGLTRGGFALAAIGLLLGAAWLVVGCASKVGPTQKMVVDEPLVSAAVADVRLSVGEGKLTLAPGATGLVSGTVSYNVAKWKPKIARTDERVTIEQGSTKPLAAGGAAVVNDWDLKLGLTPMQLQIGMGAGEGVFDLSGLSLQELDIADGAATTAVVFSSVNPSQLERFRYTAGASTVSLRGLANANLAEMEFTGATGTYALDFSGQLRSDAKAKMVVAGGTLRIEVPGTTRVQVKMKNTTAETATQGSWTIDGSTYSTPALSSGAGGKTLTIELEMTAGSATLVSK